MLVFQWMMRATSWHVCMVRGAPWFELSDDILSCGKFWEQQSFYKQTVLFTIFQLHLRHAWWEDISSDNCRKFTNSAGGDKEPAHEVCKEISGTCFYSSLARFLPHSARGQTWCSQWLKTCANLGSWDMCVISIFWKMFFYSTVWLCVETWEEKIFIVFLRRP